MPQYVWTDDEFASAADIKDGIYQYFEHPSTRMLCKGYFTNHKGIKLLTPGNIRDIDLDLAFLAASPDVIFVAHNAVVERVAWQMFMVPLGYAPIPDHRWKCTLAKAWAHGLPGKLKDCADALELEHRKMDAKQISVLFKPKKDGTFWQYHECPQLFDELYEYNIQDILTCRDIDLYLRDLIPSEQRLWEINERQNQQGIRLDMPLVRRIREFIDYYNAVNNQRFYWLTGLPRPSLRAKFKDWLERQGYPIPDTTKDTIKKLIPMIQQPWILEAVLLFQAASKSSLAKYDAMIDYVGPNDLFREILAYYAAHTGRYGGRRLQPQNLPRPVIDINQAVNAIRFDYDTFVWMYEQCA